MGSSVVNAIASSSAVANPPLRFLAGVYIKQLTKRLLRAEMERDILKQPRSFLHTLQSRLSQLLLLRQKGVGPSFCGRRFRRIPNPYSCSLISGESLHVITPKE